VSDDKPWRAPATNALAAAVAGNHDAVQAALDELSGQGPAAILSAMCAWIDTVAGRMGLHEHTGHVGVVYHSRDGLQWADEVARPSAVWAGRLFAARVNMDRDAWDALIRSIPPDHEGEYIGDLLMSLALMYENPPTPVRAADLLLNRGNHSEQS